MESSLAAWSSSASEWTPAPPSPTLYDAEWGDSSWCGEGNLDLFEDLLELQNEEEPSTDLSLEFQAILDSLPSGGEVMLGQEMVPAESPLQVLEESGDSLLLETNMELLEEELMDVELLGEEMVELELLEVSGGEGDADSAEKILDALLEGKVGLAQSYLPKKKQERKQKIQTRKTPTTTSRQKTKQDKIARKKEQNKTAATRYREKKKLEAANVSKQEEELQKLNDQLIKERDELKKQVSIVKGLVRDVMQAQQQTKKRRLC